MDTFNVGPPLHRALVRMFCPCRGAGVKLEELPTFQWEDEKPKAEEPKNA